MDYLFDTSAVSALLKQNKSIVKRINDITDKGEKIFISVITSYEVKRGIFAANATKKLEYYETLCQQYEILWIDNLEISQKAAEIHAHLKQRGQPIQDADIFIAATALSKNLTVVTTDKHFWRIPNLKVENWLIE